MLQLPFLHQRAKKELEDIILKYLEVSGIFHYYIDYSFMLLTEVTNGR